MVISQLTNNFIKTKLLELYNSKGGNYPEGVSIDLIGHFESLNTDYGKGIFRDFYGMGGILFDKINIKEVIDFDVDITDFKNNTGNIKTDFLTAISNLNKFNNLTSLGELRLENEDIRNNGLMNFPASAIEKFIVFIKLVGLTEITINDVYLIESESSLYISIAKNHPIYTGSLDIKTW